MCTVDYDGCDVWRETQRTARKEHRCDSCLAPIRPGEKYRSIFYVYEGYTGSEKCCMPCAMAIDAFANAHYATPSVGGFPEALEACIDEGDKDSAEWVPVLDALRARTPAPTEGG